MEKARIVPDISNVESITKILKQFRLSAMANALEEDLNNPVSMTLPFTERFGKIVMAEYNFRSTNKVRKYVKAANLKMPSADFNNLYGNVNRSMNMEMLMNLACVDWIGARQNVIITGPSGCGKTWISNALAVRACEKYMNVRFHSTGKLLLELRTYEPGEYLQKLRELTKPDLLILDDVGLMTLDLDSCRIFFEIMDSRYKSGSTMFISNLPVASWYGLFANKTYAEAVLSRTLENAYRLEIKGEDLRISRNTQGMEAEEMA